MYLGKKASEAIQVLYPIVMQMLLVIKQIQHENKTPKKVRKNTQQFG